MLFGLTRIGGFTVCADGLKGKDDNRPCLTLLRDQVEIVKDVLSACRATRWVRKAGSPSASELSREITAWDGNYMPGRIPLGAVIVARGRWLGQRSDGFERMPCNNTPASSVPVRLHLELSLSGL